MTAIREFRIHRFGGPEVLAPDEVEPSLPDASQVLVAVKAAGVNPVDFKIRNGKYPAVKEDRLPYTLGRDVSGVVEKCGAQATAFEVGDEVFGMVGIAGGGYAGSHAAHCNRPAHKPCRRALWPQ
jgi:NADPH:quinone reductase-like Zn-dependent oxidoreductase